MKSIFHSLNPFFRKRSRLRATLRGYSKLKDAGRVSLFQNIKSEITETPLPGIADAASLLIFGAGIINAERVVRQFLLERHIGSALYRAILLALGNNSKVVYPLPKVWQGVLIAHGVQVSVIRSSVAWAWILLLYAGRNFLSISLMQIRALAAQWRSTSLVRYVYIDGLTASNLPESGVGRSYDICSWYAQWEGRIADVEAIRHNVQQADTVAVHLRVERMALPPYLSLRGIINTASLVVWCLRAVLFACFDLMRGRWWHALLLAEAGRAKAVALTDRECLAVDYLFHYSGSIYRPLWTYEAEKKGSRIVCYFYSVSEQPKLETGYLSQRFEWGVSSWPIFLVWDKYQEEILLADIHDKPEIRVVGPIWFSGGSGQLDLSPSSVAVFDIEEYRLTSHFPTSTLGEFVAAHPDFSERFLRDIQQVLLEYGLSMAFKRKRDIGLHAKKRYKKLIREISMADNVTIVPPSSSPIKLIERCVGVISMPFTSTALYPNVFNIPSVYYDPTGWIQRDDRAAHGIPILTGPDELRRWVRETLKPKVRVQSLQG